MIAGVAGVAAALRAQGVPVAVGQVLAAHRALQQIDPAERDQAYWAIRATLCSDHGAWAHFDGAFLEGTGGLPPTARPQIGVAGGDDAPGAGGQDAAAGGGARVPAPQAWSAAELLRHKDFSECTTDELERLRGHLAVLARVALTRPGHRRAPDRRGRPDARRTLQRARRRGGDPDAVVRAAARPAVRKLVFLIDVSGSMTDYARPLLMYASAAARTRREVEVLVFGTRVHRVSRELAQRDPDRALGTLAAVATDRGAGTRICASLAELNRAWAGVLGRGAIVVVMSDGCDLGDVGRLGEEVARLRRSSHRLLWLNPHAGTPGYLPLTRGIRAVLPHVDELLAGNTPAALGRLSEVLQELVG